MEIALAIIAIAGFIGALPQLWGSSWKEVWQYRVMKSTPWDQVHDATLTVIEKLVAQSFVPCVIVGVGRGGIIGAGLICSEHVRRQLASSQSDNVESIVTAPIRLSIINTSVVFKPAASLERETTTQSISHIERINLSDPDLMLDPSDTVLVVIAQNFTGRTLGKALALVVGKGVLRNNIRTVALFWHKSKHSSAPDLVDEHEPDIYGRIISTGKTMPWKSKDASTDRF